MGSTQRLVGKPEVVPLDDVVQIYAARREVVPFPVPRAKALSWAGLYGALKRRSSSLLRCLVLRGVVGSFRVTVFYLFSFSRWLRENMPQQKLGAIA
jgi:hypothetical protein